MATYDYIIIGAGPAGTTLASRLSHHSHPLKILLIEAGPDPLTTTLAADVASPAKAPFLRGSALDWNYEGVPQKHLNGKKFYVGAGKGLGGGTIINYGIWQRGDAKDYDEWARLVGDRRWGWEGFLPYFCRTERHYEPGHDSRYHGKNGPVETSTAGSSGRKYPLREGVKKAWMSLGVEEVRDVNAGEQLGLAEWVEARTGGQRVVAAAAYSLDRVTVMTDTLVKKVLLEGKRGGTVRAIGVELADGQQISATREVIVSAGAIRTPQLLILSGIGPIEELARHDIEQLVESPEVGKNLWDHVSFDQFWKLRNPDIGASVGSPQWTDPAFLNGNPSDWYTTISVPQDELLAALSKDEKGELAKEDTLHLTPRSHIALLVYYAAPPFDGSTIMTFILNMIPTSRGTVTLPSSDPAAKPIIDHNFYATEADRYRIRTGVRTMMKMVNSPTGTEMIVGETPPEGLKPLSVNSSDEEIDARFGVAASTLQHPSGTAAMGKVVDTNLCVKGIQGLRVVDASVLPTPLSSPPQACMYALGEQAADTILEDLRSVSAQ